MDNVNDLRIIINGLTSYYNELSNFKEKIEDETGGITDRQYDEIEMAHENLYRNVLSGLRVVLDQLDSSPS